MHMLNKRFPTYSPATDHTWSTITRSAVMTTRSQPLTQCLEAPIHQVTGNSPKCQKVYLYINPAVWALRIHILTLYGLSLIRLCSATFEQLLVFWATFSDFSNLEQRLAFGATFEQFYSNISNKNHKREYSYKCFCEKFRVLRLINFGKIDYREHICC